MTLYPIEPIYRLARERHIPTGREPSHIGPAGVLAPLIGVDRGSVHRWMRRGGLPYWAADRAACALGLHPSNVWVEWGAA